MLYVGIISITLVGVLLHFFYQLTRQNKFVAVFAAVNESTWEHIKIGMTPTFIWSIIFGCNLGWNANLLMATSLALSTIIILIPLFFYTYTAFTKRAILIVDIICFIITIICSQLVFFHFLTLNVAPTFCIVMSAFLLAIELIMYFTFTFFPPKTIFFEDPITHKYGLAGHTEFHHHGHKHSHEHEHEHEHTHKHERTQAKAHTRTKTRTRTDKKKPA